MTRFTKFWAALVAGTTVFLAAGLITGRVAVWVSTGITAVGAAVAVLAAPKNSNMHTDLDRGV